MLHTPRWKIVMIAIVVLFGFAYSMPNLLPTQWRTALAENAPGFAPSQTINLGLDLRGGSHLLLAVDLDSVLTERAEELVSAVRPSLRSERIGYRRIAEASQGRTGVAITLRDENDADAVQDILRDLDNTLVVETDGQRVIGYFDNMAVDEIRRQTIDQSIEIVRRRIDETGTKEPVIQRQGDDRILVQLPGLDDPSQIKDLLGTTAKLGFHAVDDGRGESLSDATTLPYADQPGQTLRVSRRAMIGGDQLANAQVGQDQSGQPAVVFRFNGVGARRFADFSRENVGRLFAIVLDDEVISAPVINEPILGGSGQISGNFSIEEASNLSLLLRAGALPAPLNILEERTVGPSLGQDSIEAGKIASIIALAAVLIFMIITYGRFGVFADIALVINVALIFAILSTLQATLTLPGIAGIVLTIGMAVDANVLIFDRIREELDNGRSVLSAVDTGFNRAISTIIDANLTTLIATIILYSFGTGPIKGFAVTLAIGIATSMFSAIVLTRFIVSMWIRYKRPKSLKL